GAQDLHQLGVAAFVSSGKDELHDLRGGLHGSRQTPVAEITSINQKRTFGWVEATALLPVVRRITQDAVNQAESLAVRYEALPETSATRRELEVELERVILAWAAKVQKLGAEAKGLWLVDFDSGDGSVWAWRYPEGDLEEVDAA